jgi:hypothetical protein
MPVGAVGVTGAVERVCEDVPVGAAVGAAVGGSGASGAGGTGGAGGAQVDGELRALLVAAVRDCARAVSRDLGALRF